MGRPWHADCSLHLEMDAQPAKRVRGAVYILADRCKGCGFCIEFCPPKVLAFSKGFNNHGYHPPELIAADGCTGCDLCGLYCPDFAIYGVMDRGVMEKRA